MHTTYQHTNVGMSQIRYCNLKYWRRTCSREAHKSAIFSQTNLQHCFLMTTVEVSWSPADGFGPFHSVLFFCLTWTSTSWPERMFSWVFAVLMSLMTCLWSDWPEWRLCREMPTGKCFSLCVSLHTLYTDVFVSRCHPVWQIPYQTA